MVQITYVHDMWILKKKTQTHSQLITKVIPIHHFPRKKKLYDDLYALTKKKKQIIIKRKLYKEGKMK